MTNPRFQGDELIVYKGYTITIDSDGLFRAYRPNDVANNFTPEEPMIFASADTLEGVKQALDKKVKIKPITVIWAARGRWEDYKVGALFAFGNYDKLLVKGDDGKEYDAYPNELFPFSESNLEKARAAVTIQRRIDQSYKEIDILEKQMEPLKIEDVVEA